MSEYVFTEEQLADAVSLFVQNQDKTLNQEINDSKFRYEYSDDFKKKMGSLLGIVKRPKRYSRKMKVLLIAAIILIAAIAAALILQPQEKNTTGFYYSVYTDKVVINWKGAVEADAVYNLVPYKLGYIPNQYQCTYESLDEILPSYDIMYENDEEKQFSLHIASPGSSVMLSADGKIYKEFMLDGNSVKVFHDKYDFYYFVFEEDNFLIYVWGNLDYNEMMKIVEKIYK